MTFGLRCSQPARRPHPASLSLRVPTVESLLLASFSFASRLRLAFRYGCRHRLRLAPFIQRDSAHAGHTGAANLGCSRLFSRRAPRRNAAAATIGRPTSSVQVLIAFVDAVLGLLQPPVCLPRLGPPVLPASHVLL